MKISEDVLKSKGIPYIQKYPYGELSKTSKNGKRHYSTPDGRTVPSVTTVLSATKDMTHLNAWKKRVGEQKAQQIVDVVRSIGGSIPIQEAYNKLQLAKNMNGNDDELYDFWTCNGCGNQKPGFCIWNGENGSACLNGFLKVSIVTK